MKHGSKFFGLVALTTLVSFPVFAQSAGSQQENNAPQQQEKTNAQQADGTAARTRKSVTGCSKKATKPAAIRSRPTTAPHGSSGAANLI
jgi:uncharacterized protein YdeI (BOF family)